ncbi:putative DUF2188 protein [Cyclonatronum proteinivorum]|uniref:Putative DUF2188 protein n=1 Tax=Cyclonatronum proteinivorum TaxID=1457365 RepID=A0A345UND7_9BACT|nr:DUF2188 domain-containing protein [Cyclonatronum proteinivorum]AXJ01989.1 putative DUF2188 protein [Cyclonatronum proteinivorum]
MEPIKAKPRVHVIKRDKGWAVKIEGAQRALRVFKSKEQAIKVAEMTGKDSGDVVIHKKDGSIQKWIKAEA